MIKLEPTNLKNTGLGGFWNFAYMSESCGWEDAVAPFRKKELDEVLQYLQEHPYLISDPDISVNINIPHLSYTEFK